MNSFLMQLSGQAENRLYGHINVLAKYCGLSGEPWLNGYLQHGWNATDGFGNYLGSKRFAQKYVWSTRCEEIIKSNGKKNVIAIGAPWLYLNDIYPIEDNAERQGVISYPAHSSAGSKIGDTSYEYSRYLKEKYGKVTVVLHRYDFENKHIVHNYKNLGHIVTSHGVGNPWEKNYNQNYLKEIRDLISRHNLIVSNLMGTAILYGLSLGLEVEIGGPYDVSITEKNDLASQLGDGTVNWTTELTEKNKILLWQNELGLKNKKQPDKLKEILGWTNNKKNKRYFIVNRSLDLVFGSNKLVSVNLVRKNLVKK